MGSLKKDGNQLVRRRPTSWSSMAGILMLTTTIEEQFTESNHMGRLCQGMSG